MNLFLKAAGALSGVLTLAATVHYYHSTTSVQKGNPGLAMETIETRGRIEERILANDVPAPLPPSAPGGPLAVDAYKNVQVLGHVTSAEMTRIMTAISGWVAPQQGCAYCHAPQRDANGNVVKDEEGYVQADLANMHSDELYTKRVARRMIQMTMRINADWQPHVKQTGVTCYTCHRGNPVPANIWFDEPIPEPSAMMGNKADQNMPADVAGLTSLPATSLRPFLASDANIRVQSQEAIGSDNHASIKETEWTYSLMIHMSKSLGVNCTYCHNSRSMGAWEASPPTRAQAWFGIRMVRELNRDYLEPLQSSLPAVRLGPLHDGPKVNCATCHAGAFKPLLGASMLKDYPVLAAAKPQPEPTPPPAPPVEAAPIGDAGAPREAGAPDAGGPRR